MRKKFKNLKPIQKGLFTLLIGFSVISFWRGAWGIMDLYIFPSNQELSFWTSIIIGLIILAITDYWSKELA